MTPRAEPGTVAVRALGVLNRKPKRGSRFKPIRRIAESDLSLIFDCETQVIAPQQLRVGAYQLRRRAELREAGLFFDPASLGRRELRLLRRYVKANGLMLRTDREFVDWVFYGIAFKLNATIVGFNLPFDLSRLAVAHDSARGRMRGGFSFQLSTDPRWPRVQIRHLSNRAALIRFAAQRRQRTARSQRKRRRRVPIRRGFFADLKALSSSLVGGSHSLASLSQLLDTPHKKSESDQHGKELASEYLDYLSNDVQVTWECFERLRDLWASYKLRKTPLTQLYSEASLGKALLREMGIEGWRKLQPRFPRRSIGRFLVTYYGGRSEVRLRRKIARVLYLDFLSMYPTVCTLMGLWRFVIAKGVRSEDVTAEIRKLLRTLKLEDLRYRDLWRMLTTIVQVGPERHVFPIRSKYDGLQYTIGLNYLTSNRPMWFTLADCIVATLLTGRAPKVLRALRYVPLEPQEGLEPIELLGKPEYRIDPYQDDLFKRLIEMRAEVRRRWDEARTEWGEAAARRLGAQQQALKILASATSYGIFVELNVLSHADMQDLVCYGLEEPFPAASRNVEEPGSYFHPLLATLITGAARLMLAITEVLTEREGLGWMFCDTDGWTLVKPEKMAEEEFLRRAGRIRRWFQVLNPYDIAEPSLKLEDANFRVEEGKLTDELEPLYGFAVSDKRYVLFNLDASGRPVIRKGSAHAVGHLIGPYGDKEAPADIRAPVMKLKDIGVERWQHDLWYRITWAALEGRPGEIDLDLPGFERPAVARYAATTPVLLQWFKRFNKGKSYREQVRPFGFLYAYQTRRREHTLLTEVADSGASPKRRRRTRAEDLPRAVAPYDKDLELAARGCFDRETGEPVAPEKLPTYRQALAQYHLHPEDKFLNGDFTDSGGTSRRHIEVAGIEHTGKEAERWEEQFYLGLDPEAQIVYGDAPAAREVRLNDLIRAGERFGRRRLASTSGVSLGEISMVLRGVRKPGLAVIGKLIHGISELERIEATSCKTSDEPTACCSR